MNPLRRFLKYLNRNLNIFSTPTIQTLMQEELDMSRRQQLVAKSTIEEYELALNKAKDYAGMLQDRINRLTHDLEE